MAEFVAILEDSTDRISGFKACAAKLFPNAQIIVLDQSQQMIEWLKQHLTETLFISLDHDLPYRPLEDGTFLDFGNGMEVADYLSTLPPVCPIVVHSSNDTAAQDMVIALKESGWPCHRVYPCGGDLWISTAWAETVNALILNGWINPRRSEESDRSK